MQTEKELCSFLPPRVWSLGKRNWSACVPRWICRWSLLCAGHFSSARSNVQLRITSASEKRKDHTWEHLVKCLLFYVRWHFASWQDSISKELPPNAEHGSALPLMTVSEQSRVRTWIPAPHETLQLDHALHSSHRTVSGTEVKTMACKSKEMKSLLEVVVVVVVALFVVVAVVVVVFLVVSFGFVTGSDGNFSDGIRLDWTRTRYHPKISEKSMHLPE